MLIYSAHPPADSSSHSYGTTTQTSAHEVAIPSPWLRDNKADIVEILHGGEIVWTLSRPRHANLSAPQTSRRSNPPWTPSTPPTPSFFSSPSLADSHLPPLALSSTTWPPSPTSSSRSTPSNPPTLRRVKPSKLSLLLSSPPTLSPRFAASPLHKLWRRSKPSYQQSRVMRFRTRSSRRATSARAFLSSRIVSPKPYRPSRLRQQRPAYYQPFVCKPLATPSPRESTSPPLREPRSPTGCTRLPRTWLLSLLRRTKRQTLF